MKLVAFVFSVISICFLHAQQRPQYTQYILNNYIINPALAGIENYTDVKVSHRHQWVGILDAPVTTYITISSPINKKDWRTNATSFNVPGENPRGKAYWEEYSAAKPHSGWGLTMVNDQTGALNRFSLYGTYAYHLGLTEKTSLAAGFSGGITNNTLNASKLIFDNPVDPAVAGSGYLNKLIPDAIIGLWLYSANYFAGLSVHQILPQKLSFSSDTLKANNKAFPYFFINAGYKFFLNDDISIIPSAVVRYCSALPTVLDVNVKAQYRDLLWVGSSYRLKDGFAGMLGVNVSNAFNISYAYDYTISRLQTFTKGTHEIVLGFLIGNKYGDWCPRNLW